MANIIVKLINHIIPSIGVKLFNTCRNNDTKTALKLLSVATKNDINHIEKDDENNSTLLWAMCCDMDEVCWKLINNGADIYHINDDEKSALYYSLIKGKKWYQCNNKLVTYFL